MCTDGDTDPCDSKSAMNQDMQVEWGNMRGGTSMETRSEGGNIGWGKEIGDAVL